MIEALRRTNAQRLRHGQFGPRKACVVVERRRCHTGSRMLLVILLGSLLAGGPSLDSAQQARLDRLEHALLAPCCYQEVVATHNSEAAKQMRAELAEMVAAGRSDREILDFYKQRYGKRILAEPEGAQWWIMNIVPVVMLLGGAAVVIHLVRKWRRASASQPA